MIWAVASAERVMVIMKSVATKQAGNKQLATTREGDVRASRLTMRAFLQHADRLVMAQKCQQDQNQGRHRRECACRQYSQVDNPALKSNLHPSGTLPATRDA